MADPKLKIVCKAPAAKPTVKFSDLPILSVFKHPYSYDSNWYIKVSRDSYIADAHESPVHGNADWSVIPAKSAILMIEE